MFVTSKTTLFYFLLIFSLQNAKEREMMRRKVEFEGKQIQEMFLQNLGTAEQISQRQEVRLSRISGIETEILDLQKARKAKVWLSSKMAGPYKVGG